MSEKHGSLSINSENIFPIIKKWMYSDHDIFVRELISNGSDAITKLKKLEVIGEYSFPEGYKPSIEVTVNPKEKTLTFSDNGIGMNQEEVEQYITQIAFSGATDFLEKYKGKTNEDQMIGHFGLGFYSAFMVADLVEINTLSFAPGATAVHWECDGGTEYTLTEGTKDTIGTEIILHLSENSTEFSNEFRVREVIEKYCSFMPVPIFLQDATAALAFENIEAKDLTPEDVLVEKYTEPAKTEKEKQEDGTEKEVEIAPAKEMAKINKRPVSLSDTTPLWTKHPNDCTKEEYIAFYRTVFHDYKEPLFWIHLNMDYPFNLKGILYFPKLNLEYESAEGVIKLYNNQVFIADNIKEVIPEYLLLLKGVLDCPDLPLNVSRSALQNDGFVGKISEYISKKVADKLTGLCKVDRAAYESYWDDINPFLKYGCLKDAKFGERMADSILFKNLDGAYATLPEILPPAPEKEKEETKDASAPEKDAEKSAEEEKEPEKETLYYVTDEVLQSQYIRMFKDEGKQAYLLKENIDSPFLSWLEQQKKTVKFQRIDGELTSDFTSSKEDAPSEEQQKTLTELFRKSLKKEDLLVKAEHLKNASVASLITLSEESRRMQDMMKMYGMATPGDDSVGNTLVLNTGNALVSYLLEHPEGEHTELFCKQLYDLAQISHHPLSPEAMNEFILRSNEIMGLLMK